MGDFYLFSELQRFYKHYDVTDAFLIWNVTTFILLDICDIN